MRLKFQKIPTIAVPPILGGIVGLLFQFISPRLTCLLLLSMGCVASLEHHTSGLTFIFAVIASWMFVPFGDDVRLSMLLVDAVGVALLIVGRRANDARWMYAAFAFAAVLGQPTSDSLPIRAMKLNTAFFLGILLWSDADLSISVFHGRSSAPLHVALVLLFGPLYTVYGVFMCCRLSIDQLEIY